MTHQERSRLKESLRLQYITITDYQKRFLFWREHQGNLQYVDSVKYSEPYSQANKKKEQNDIELNQAQFDKGKKGAIIDTSGLWIEISKIKDLIEIEDEIKGIQEPAPPTKDQDKAFVAKHWLDYQLSIRTNSDASIYDFEVFKNDFESNLKDYLTDEDKKLFAERKLEKVTERIINQVQVWKVAHGVSDVYLCKGEPSKSDEKEQIEYFFEDYVKKMHNEQKVLLLLYKCSQINYQLYEYASFLIPLYQCKRFLESYIKQQEYSNIEKTNNLASGSNSKATAKLILAKTNDLAIYVYFLGKLGIGTEISLNKHNESKVEYEKHISIFNAKYFPNTDNGFKLESLIAGINLIGDFIEKEVTPTNKKEIIKKINRVQKQLIQDYPNKSDNIKELLSSFL